MKTESELLKKMEKDVELFRHYFPASHSFEVVKKPGVNDALFILSRVEWKNMGSIMSEGQDYAPDIKPPPHGTEIEFVATLKGPHDPETTALGWSFGSFETGFAEHLKPLKVACMKNKDGDLIQGGHAFKWRTIGGEWVE